MNYLMPNELLQNGWTLYWARTGKEWGKELGLKQGFQSAMNRYHELVQEYRLITYSTPSSPSSYMAGYRQGELKRQVLSREGLPLETMSNNTYRGTNFLGLYGYMDAMEGRCPR